METFYITFGQKYTKDNPHPIWGVTRDNAVRVEAESEDRARYIIVGLIGDMWSFMYTEEDFKGYQKYFSGKIYELSIELDEYKEDTHF